MRLDSVAIVLFVWKNAVQCWGGRVGEWESGSRGEELKTQKRMFRIKKSSKI